MRLMLRHGAPADTGQMIPRAWNSRCLAKGYTADTPAPNTTRAVPSAVHGTYSTSKDAAAAARIMGRGETALSCLRLTNQFIGQAVVLARKV
jgi:hypothetical protein